MKTKNWNYKPKRDYTVIGTVIGGLILFFSWLYFIAGLSIILK